MDLPEDRRKRTMRKLEFEDRRRGRGSLYLRLTPAEQEDLEDLAERMGGVTRSAVVEEALRRYLVAISANGKFTKEGLASAPPLARHYKIRSDVRTALERVCAKRGWQYNEIARHALIALRNQIETGAERGGRRP